jgi:hypothetical protein
VPIATKYHSSDERLTLLYPMLLQTTVVMDIFYLSLLCYHCSDGLVVHGHSVLRPNATVGTLQTGCPRVQDLSLVPQRQTLHLAGKGSDVATCPIGSRPAPGAGHLWHRARYPIGKGSGVTTCPTALDPLLVQEGFGFATCGRAHRSVGKGSGVAMCPATLDPSPSAGGLWRCHMRLGPSIGKGSGVTTCPTAPDPPPGVGGLWCHHVRPGPPPGREGFWCCHVSRSSRPAS